MVILIRKKNKFGQMKIQQMAFMLIALTLFFVLIGLAILAFQFAGLKEKSIELEQDNAMKLVTSLANSPEFSCGNSYNFAQTNCVDLDKVMALKSNIKDYQGFWDVADIEIRKIYPEQTNNANRNIDIECTLSNYQETDCNLIKVYSKNVNKGSAQSVFVSLCKKESIQGEVYDKCGLSKLIVNYEVKS